MHLCLLKEPSCIVSRHLSWKQFRKVFCARVRFVLGHIGRVGESMALRMILSQTESEKSFFQCEACPHDETNPDTQTKEHQSPAQVIVAQQEKQSDWVWPSYEASARVAGSPSLSGKANGSLRYHSAPVWADMEIASTPGKGCLGLSVDQDFFVTVFDSRLNIIPKKWCWLDQRFVNGKPCIDVSSLEDL